MSYGKILVPVDCSDRSLRAVEHAVTIGAKFDAEIDMLYVAPPASTYMPLERMLRDATGTEDVEFAVRNAARKALDEARGKLPERIRDRVRPHVEVGVPYEVIIRQARSGGYDLIILNTKGRTGAKHILLGSIAERVVRHAPCPVLVVR